MHDVLCLGTAKPGALGKTQRVVVFGNELWTQVLSVNSEHFVLHIRIQQARCTSLSVFEMATIVINMPEEYM